ncbi:MAG: hypothetical protein GY793_06500 [Proteobacteria bacterium]|nr:hypothetical protein [Pseudomonadota bacterium]
MATRLIVTFTDIIQATGYLDVTASITCNFKYTTPAITGDVQIKDNVNDQALEFYTRFNADFNGLGDFDTHIQNNVVYINDLIDVAPVFDDAITDIPEIDLDVVVLEDYENLYNSSYTDNEGVDHYINIKQKYYYGFSTSISASGVLHYADNDDVGNSIIGSGFSILVDADVDLTYEDLFTEDARTFLISYTRNSATLFNGWLTPEGFYEDYVSDKWQITLECVDGLGFLKDLSYVDADGLFYTGKQSQLEIISNCLIRTGIEQNISTNIDIYYTGLSTSLDVLDNVYYNADRFIKDDGDTLMSCEEVLMDVLEPYQATIISYNGQWFIYKLNQLADDSDRQYFSYDYLGATLIPASFDYNNYIGLGSQMDGYYPHHVNGNQSLSNRKSLGAYRISYKYGFDKSILDNTRLYKDGTIDEWTINDALIASGSSGGYGIDLDLANPVTIGATSDVVSLSINDVINYSGSFTTIGDAVLFYSIVKLVNGGTTYYLQNNGEWTTSATYIVFENSKKVTGAVFPEQEYVGTDAQLNFEVESDKLPISGDLTIQFYASRVDNVSGDSVGHLKVSYISIAAIGSDTNIIGEFHTVQREDNPSANVKDVKEVNVGDNPSDLYLGTIYKTDETTPTSTWFRKGITEEKPLLQLMGEELLRLNAQTSRVFNGDAYGYIPYFSIISINNITGGFFPIKYTYNTLNNVTTLTSKQIFGDELADIDYEMTYDYGKTVKPTIKG